MRLLEYPYYKSDVTTCEYPEGFRVALVRAIEQDEDRHICLGERQSSSTGQMFLLARFTKPSIFLSRMGPQIGGEPKMPLKLMTVWMGVFPEIISTGCKVKHALGEGKSECRFKNKRMDMCVKRTTKERIQASLPSTLHYHQSRRIASQMKRVVTKPGYLLGILWDKHIGEVVLEMAMSTVACFHCEL